MASQPKVLPPGTVLDGRFEIGEVLGLGGMAVVYDAKQLTLFSRPVAVKVLDRDLAADGAYRKRFAREAGLIAALVHEHIVPVHDYGDGGGHLYIAMQRIDGGTLAQRLRRGKPLSGADALSVLRAVASALDYAHGLGLLHRDIKPENILLQQRGERERNVLLADFGIARGVGGAAHTATGGMLGTLRYASPEQLGGADVGPASDLYSLAVVAYEALTGAPGPYLASSHARYLFAHLNARPVELGPADEPAARAAYEVLCWGLEKRAEARPETATAFVDALADAIGDGPELQDRSPAFSQARGGAAPAAIDAWVEESDVEPTGRIPGETAELGGETIGETERSRPFRRRPAAWRYWPVAIAAAALVVPAASVLGRESDPTATTSRSGKAGFVLPTDLAPTEPASLVSAVVLPGVSGQTQRAVGSGRRGVAVITRTTGRSALAPSDYQPSSAADVVRIAGGTARRYATPSGTVYVAQTANEVVWLGCTASLTTCGAIAGSLAVSGERLRADPLPEVASVAAGALDQVIEVRQRLRLPARDRTVRERRAGLVAERYGDSSRRLRELVADRPRDRDVAALAAAVRSGELAFDRLATAAAARSASRDAAARKALRASDAALRRALVSLERRGYKVSVS